MLIRVVYSLSLLQASFVGYLYFLAWVLLSWHYMLIMFQWTGRNLWHQLLRPITSPFWGGCTANGLLPISYLYYSYLRILLSHTPRSTC